MIHRSLVTDSATAPPVTTWCPTARAASRAGPTVGGYAAWPWRSVWVKSGYSGEPDFTDGWRVDLRLEHNLAMNPGQVYPRCTGGRRAGPPEGYGGVLAFLEQTQPLHVLAATIRAAEILGMLLEAEEVERLGPTQTPRWPPPGGVPPELDQPGLVRVQRQADFAKRWLIRK